MAGSRTPAAAFPKPDRPVADIVSPIWHGEEERDDAGEPTQFMHQLGIKSEMTVADIGAGSGYYVVRLSPIVGPRGRVVAEDIVPEYLRALRNRVGDLGLENVVIGLGEPHDPRLPAAHVPRDRPALRPALQSSLARVSALSTPTGQCQSMALHRVSCAVSLQL